MLMIIQKNSQQTKPVVYLEVCFFEVFVGTEAGLPPPFGSSQNPHGTWSETHRNICTVKTDMYANFNIRF